MNTKRIKLFGRGKMAKAFRDLAREYPVEIVEDNWDVVVDFSRPENLEKVLEAANGKPCFIGTTGYTQEQKKKLDTLNVYYRANASEIACDAFNHFLRLPIPKAYLVEDIHDISKRDSPSGTALAIKEVLEQSGVPVEIKSIREPGVMPENRITFFYAYEQITVSHKATDRKAYAKGFLERLTK